MSDINNIVAEFNTLVPGIKTSFQKYIRRSFKHICEEYPDGKSRQNLYNQYGPDGNTFRFIREFVVYSTESSYGMKELYRPSSELYINEDRLEKKSQQYAQDQVDQFSMKLVRKLEDLEDVTLTDINLNTFEFSINGTIQGKKVHVNQMVVFKLSKLGTPFNQWPARIWVDGKKVSEKQFKEMKNG